MKNGIMKIGEIGVDAGICWVGDPSYILHRKKNPKAIGKNWEDFCNKIEGGYTQFNYDLGHPGLGVLVTSGYGDGTYPVFAEIINGRIKSITVKFFNSVEEEEARMTAIATMQLERQNKEKTTKKIKKTKKR